MQITDEQIEKMAGVYDCICPTLNSRMEPKFELRDHSECPNHNLEASKRGECDECVYFLGTRTDEGNMYHSSGLYKLACLYKSYTIVSVSGSSALCKHCNQIVDFTIHCCL